jgi:hypothetical protein
MSERRTSPRRKSFLRGCIYFNRNRSAADCLIRDISEQGARLIFSSTVAIPDIVDLYVPQKEQTLRAHVQWRHGDELGVAFIENQRQATDTPADENDIGHRVKVLEDEVAKLRRALRRLQTTVASMDRTDAA